MSLQILSAFQHACASMLHYGKSSACCLSSVCLCPARLPKSMATHAGLLNGVKHSSKGLIYQVQCESEASLWFFSFQHPTCQMNNGEKEDCPTIELCEWTRWPWGMCASHTAAVTWCLLTVINQSPDSPKIPLPCACAKQHPLPPLPNIHTLNTFIMLIGELYE